MLAHPPPLSPLPHATGFRRPLLILYHPHPSCTHACGLHALHVLAKYTRDVPRTSHASYCLHCVADTARARCIAASVLYFASYLS